MKVPETKKDRMREDQVKLEKMIEQLNPADPGCRDDIARLRREMDQLCDRGLLSIGDWRILLGKIANIQAEQQKTRRD